MHLRLKMIMKINDTQKSLDGDESEVYSCKDYEKTKTDVQKEET